MVKRKPNIVLITADSLRADHVGCYGLHPAHSLTPNIDWLAGCGVLFQNAFAQAPHTTCSVPAIFTGKYPCRLKPLNQTLPLWDLWGGVVVEGVATLAEILRENGYHTAAFHSNPLLSRLFGFQKGFDVFFDDVHLGSTSLPAKLKLLVAQSYRLVRVDPFMSAERLNAMLRTWLAKAAEPFFVWVHYMDTHGPYLQRKVLKYLSADERAWRTCNQTPAKVTPRQRDLLLRNYRSQISYLDAQLGRLWQEFATKDLFARSAVLLSADHGDEFFEHGGYAHHYQLYDELLHVPLLMSAPEVAPARVNHVTEIIQLAPTILEFAGVGPVEGLDAESLLPLLWPGHHPRKLHSFSEAGMPVHDNVCVRNLEWKLIYSEGGKTRKLYRIAADPAEQFDVADRHLGIVAELEQAIHAHLAHRRHDTEASEHSCAAVQASKEEERLVEERLRDLGYI